MKSKMIINQAQVDAISDEFGSTFGIVGKQTLRNIIKQEELALAEGIIKKHFPNAKIEFEVATKIDQSRSIYLVRLTFK